MIGDGWRDGDHEEGGLGSGVATIPRRNVGFRQKGCVQTASQYPIFIIIFIYFFSPSRFIQIFFFCSLNSDKSHESDFCETDSF